MRTLRTTREERAEILAASALFRDLPRAEREGIAGVALVREFAPDEYLFLQEQPAELFYVVAAGQVKVHRSGADGREQVLHLLGRGDLCGEVPVFAGRDYPASAVAVGPVKAACFARARFLGLARQHPELLLGLLAVASERLRRFVNLIDDLSLKEVSARLARHLLDLVARSPGANVVELDSTKATLASRVGTIAETLSRTLRKMQARKIIDVRGRRITILHRTELERLAAGEKL